jgi:hypothetical protein
VSSFWTDTCIPTLSWFLKGLEDTQTDIYFLRCVPPKLKNPARPLGVSEMKVLLAPLPRFLARFQQEDALLLGDILKSLAY